jgi:hypothetical protein
VGLQHFRFETVVLRRSIAAGFFRAGPFNYFKVERL